MTCTARVPAFARTAAGLLISLVAPAAPAAPRPAAQPARPSLMLQLGHTNWIFAAAFSPDGRFFATGGDDHHVILWDSATGIEIGRLRASDQVLDVAVSPDGRSAAAAVANAGALVWDVATGRHVCLLDAPFARSVEFSPDGRHLLTSGGSPFPEHNVAIVWDLATGAEVRRFGTNPKMLMFAVYAPDGRHVLLGGFDPELTVWDAASGARIAGLRGHTGPVRYAAISPDGRVAATSSDDNTVRLWDLRAGVELRRFDCPESAPSGVAISPDGARLLAGDTAGAARLWDIRSGAEVWRGAKQPNRVYAAAFSPDGRLALVTAGATVVLHDAEVGVVVRSMEGATPGVYSVAVSPDGRRLATAVGKTPRIWDFGTGAEVLRLQGHETRVVSVEYSPDGSLLLTGGHDNTVRVWDAETGRELRRIGRHENPLRVAAWSPDGRAVLTASRGETVVRVWDAVSAAEVASFQHRPEERVSGAAWSPDGRRVVTGTSGATAYVWDVARGASITRIAAGDDVGSVAFTPDGSRVLTTGVVGPSAWDAATGRSVYKGSFGDFQVPSCFAFSPDGRLVATGDGYESQQSRPGAAYLWDLATGRQLAPLRGHGDIVGDVTFSRDGRFIATASRDGTARLWETSSGRELCRMVSFRDGSWAAVDAEGRFDSNNLDSAGGLYWVVPDDPLSPLPLELFLRDYYEPRLLARLLAGERFRPVRDIGSLDRLRPAVTVADVRPGPSAGTMSVSVRVAGGGSRRAAPAFDRKLFRDGQLVGLAPERGGEVALDPATREAIVTFPGVRVPAGAASVEFSAYAFNRDGIKSPTDRRTCRVPGPPAAPRRRAYVVSVGVNTHDDPTLDLSFAADDARETAAALAERLRRSERFDECVAVTLISDSPGRRLATKSNFHALLDLLAGKPVDPAVVAAIPGAAALRAAGPDDFVLVTFAGHGYADGRGNFYLVPSDVGAGAKAAIAALGGARALAHGPAASAGALERCVSSDDLARWLRDVDAGDTAMIIDACQSAALTGEDFKPGPMGSRGLGQLAYDKRMRILAATQADDVALEVRNLRHGLVTYTLLREGLGAGRADFRPRDSSITLSEWLAYAVERVPLLSREVRAGRVAGPDAPRVLAHGPAATPAQQPSLFDFSRKRGDIVLSRVSGEN